MNIKIGIHWIFKCLLTIGFASLIYYASSRDTSSVPLPPYSDKLIHFTIFGLLCLLICWTLSSVTIGSKWYYKIILAISVTSLYGVSDEFHQFFTPHRSVEFLDWLADTAGAATAGVLWHIATSKRQAKKEKFLTMRKSPINDVECVNP